MKDMPRSPGLYGHSQTSPIPARLSLPETLGPWALLSGEPLRGPDHRSSSHSEKQWVFQCQERSCLVLGRHLECCSLSPQATPQGPKPGWLANVPSETMTLGIPRLSHSSLGKASCTPPKPSQMRPNVPGPPRGQTQLQVRSFPVAPCGGASGGGGRHLSCGTPGGTSSQRERRTPSPRPQPLPACAVGERRQL